MRNFYVFRLGIGHDYRYRMHVIECALYSVSLGDNDFPCWLVLFFTEKHSCVFFDTTLRTKLFYFNIYKQ